MITDADQSGSAHGGQLKSRGRVQTLSVQCGQLGGALSLLGVQRLDFISVDVEGAELHVLRSLDFSTLSLGVALVEVRGDGVRPGVMRFLLRHGMTYVGSWAWTAVNSIIDDVFVNITHMARFFPQSVPSKAARRAAENSKSQCCVAACVRVCASESSPPYRVRESSTHTRRGVCGKSESHTLENDV